MDEGLLEAMETIERLHEQADRLKAYADEVKAGVITRTKPGDLPQGDL